MGKLFAAVAAIAVTLFFGNVNADPAGGGSKRRDQPPWGTTIGEKDENSFMRVDCLEVASQGRRRAHCAFAQTLLTPPTPFDSQSFEETAKKTRAAGQQNFSSGCAQERAADVPSFIPLEKEIAHKRLQACESRNVELLIQAQKDRHLMAAETCRASVTTFSGDFEQVTPTTWSSVTSSELCGSRLVTTLSREPEFDSLWSYRQVRVTPPGGDATALCGKDGVEASEFSWHYNGHRPIGCKYLSF